MRKNILYIVMGFLTVGCKSLETNLHVAENPLPTTYNITNDSTGIEQLNWKDYFSDSLLIALIDTAINRNYDLQMSMQRIEMARAGVRLAKGQQLPVVDGVTSFSQFGFGENSADWAGNEGGTFADGSTLNRTAVPDYYLGLQASWEADVWGKLKNQKRV